MVREMERWKEIEGNDEWLLNVTHAHNESNTKKNLLGKQKGSIYLATQRPVFRRSQIYTSASTPLVARVNSSRKQCERTAVFIFTSIAHCLLAPLRSKRNIEKKIDC